MIAAADPELAVYDVRPLAHRLARSMASQRFTTWLLTLFAGLGLTLTAIGLYGVLAYGVGQRLREFGVRLALGASPGHIAGRVVTGALAVVVGGLAVGLGVAVALGRVLESLLDFVRSPGLTTIVTVAALMLLTAAAAALAPIRRALRVDPVRTLRAE